MSAYSSRLRGSKAYRVAAEPGGAAQLWVFILGKGYFSLGVLRRVFRLGMRYTYSSVKFRLDLKKWTPVSREHRFLCTRLQNIKKLGSSNTSGSRLIITWIIRIPG